MAGLYETATEALCAREIGGRKESPRPSRRRRRFAALGTDAWLFGRPATQIVVSQPPESPAYDAEWATRDSSKDRLIFEFSVVVLDLDGDDFDVLTTRAKRRMPPPLTCADGLAAPR